MYLLVFWMPDWRSLEIDNTLDSNKINAQLVWEVSNSNQNVFWKGRPFLSFFNWKVWHKTVYLMQNM